MSDRKQQRQTTLLSFFCQPLNEKNDQSSAKKSRKKTLKRNQHQVQPNGAASDGAASPTTTTDARERPVVSPIESSSNSKNESGIRRTNTSTRKRPRPKSSTVQHNPQDESSAHSSADHKGNTLISDPTGGTGDDKVKQFIGNDDHQKQQEEVSAAIAISIQNKNEEDLSTDSEKETETNDDEEGNMSAYELLRQRNIERNNARLASLGLLNATAPLQQQQQQLKKKPRRARKTPSKIKAPTGIPTRRSTRSRRSVLDANAETTASTSLDNATEKSHKPDGKAVQQEEAEETYTVSPLLQYAMVKESSSTETPNVGPSWNDSTFAAVDCGKSNSKSSLYPMGPRLAPPKGLKAIYSLDFSAPFHSNHRTWLVGAGKAGIVALWDCKTWASHSKEDEEENCIDPTLMWKAHNGRWIAEARFLPSTTDSTSSGRHPATRLVTAANDGKVCLWDLSTVSVRSGAPKLLSQSGGDLHTSGIFAMDVINSTAALSSSQIRIVTGSKDKTVALSVLSSNEFRPIWKSNFHAAKVGAVRLHPTRNSILASASDDDFVCVHDSTCGEKNGLVIALEQAHHRPHSVVWDPYHADLLMTAGLDKEIKIWDIRSTKEPMFSLQGHVPENTSRCKRIHHPTFYFPRGRDGASFVLSGGERSQALSMFHHHSMSVKASREEEPTRLYSRGKLPVDCGDAGCIAVNDDKVAVSVQDGEILILSPMLHDKKQ